MNAAASNFELSLTVATNDAETRVTAVGTAAVKTGRAFDSAAKSTTGSTTAISRHSAAAAKAETTLSRLLSTVQTKWAAARKVVVAGSVAMAAAVALYNTTAGIAVKASAEFERGLIGIGKTADIQGAGLRALGDDIDALSRRLPTSSAELLEIGQAAGQLGVSGAANILKFTETVARLGSASDLAGEEAATALARILNVTGESVETVGTLASTIVALGNSFAATESQIAHHTGEVARATAVFSLGSGVAAAFGTVLAAFGVRAELSGSAVGRSFRTIENAVKSGGLELQQVARIARVSSDELVEAWGRSPLEAFQLFLKGTRELIAENGNVAASLESVGLSGEEVLKVIPVLAKEYDVLARALDVQAREQQNATALMIESERSNLSLSASFAILRNQLQSVLRLIGDELTRSVGEIVSRSQDWLNANRDLFVEVGQRLASALRRMVETLALVSEHFGLVEAAVVALIVRLVLLQAIPLLIQFGAWVKAMQAVIVTIYQSTAALRLSSVALIGWGKAWGALTAAMAANPIGLIATAIGLLAGGLYLAWRRTREAKEEQAAYHAELESGLPTFEGANQALSDLADTLDRLRDRQSAARRDTQELAKRLAELVPILEQAKAAGESGDIAAFEKARKAAADLGVFFDRLSGRAGGVARLSSEVAALEAELKAAQASGEAAADGIAEAERRLGESIEERIAIETRNRAERESGLERLRADLIRTQQEISDLLAAGGDERSGFFHALQMLQREARDLTRELELAEQGLARVTGRMADLAADSNLRIGELFRAGDAEGLQSFIESLPEDLFARVFGEQSTVEGVVTAYLDAIARADEYARKQEELADRQEQQEQATKEQLERFAELRAEIAGSTEEAGRYAQVIGQGLDAEQRVLDQIELEKRLRSEARDLTAAQRSALRELIAVQLQAERVTTGQQTIQDLEDHLAGLRKVTVAYRQGDEAVAGVNRALRVEAAFRQEAAAAAEEQRDRIRELLELIEREEAAAFFEERRSIITQEIQDLDKLVAAQSRGTVAVEQTRAALEVEAQIRQETAGFMGREREELERLTRTRIRLNATLAGRGRVSDLKAELEFTRELAGVKRSDFATEREYQLAIAEINLQKQIRVELLAIEAQRMAAVAAVMGDATLTEEERADALAEVNREFATQARQARSAATEIARLNREMEEDRDVWTIDSWVEAGRTLADVLREIDSELGTLADSAVDLLVAFEHIGTAAGNIDFAVAAGNFAQALAKTISGPNNYAAEGSLVGAILGAIIGGYVTGGSAAGIQAGAAIGGAAGGALGGLIKKGADEFLAEFELSAHGTLSGIETKVEGQMASIGRRYIAAIERGIAAALDQLGAFLIGIPDVAIKVREGVFSVFVGEIVGRFESMQEAVDFAILEVLRQGDIIGLSPEVRTAIQNSTAETFEDLFEDIQFAQWLERLPEIGQAASESAAALFAAVDQYQAALRKANELGLETAKIDQWFVTLLASIRNNVLGIVETEEERLRREVEGFNLTVQLLRAEQEMRRADLLLKRAETQAELELLAAKHKITLAELQAMAAHVAAQGRLTKAMAAIGKATLEMAHAMFQALAAIDLALATVDSILANLPELISDEELQAALDRLGAAGAGGGAGERERREQERRDALREIEDLRLLAEGMTEAALSIRRGFEDFEEWAAEARKLGIAEEALAQARRDNLKLLTDEFLEPFLEVIRAAGESDFETALRSLSERYADALQEAGELAAEAARLNGTTLAEELAKLQEILDEAFSVEAAVLFRDEFSRLLDAGDLAGLRELQRLFETIEDLPPGLAAEIEAVIEAMEALGLGTGFETPGLDVSGIADALDLLAGLSDVGRDLRDLQLRFLAVIAQARALGASEADLSRLRQAHTAALGALRDSILESVQEYTDAVLGIGEFQRRLIDLRALFASAREDLAAVDDALESQDDLFGVGGDREREGFEREIGDRIESFERTVIEGLDRLIEAVRDRFGLEPAPRGRTSDGLDVGRPRDELGGTGRDLGDLADQIRDLRRETRDLTDDMGLLEEAERRAIRQLGFDFIGSLDALGVALPTELTLELAHAQFELARAEAISSALALAAAGAFAGLSFSLQDLLELITGASFEASQFAPRAPSGAGGGAGGGGEEDRTAEELARVRLELAEQADAWSRLNLGEVTNEAIDLRRQFLSLAREADRLGLSTAELSAAYRIAVATLVDDALAEFERLGESPLERELNDLVSHFEDLTAAFHAAGADAEQMARLQTAFATAMEDFLERATAGIRSLLEELRAEDPRRSSEQRFTESQARFRELLARAQGGDLEAIAELEGAAREFRTEALAFLGGGVGAQNVLDELLAGLESIGEVELVPEDIALLQEQLARLEELVNVNLDQPTKGTEESGHSGVRQAVDRIGDAVAENQDTLTDILLALSGVLMVNDSLSRQELDEIFRILSGVIDVSDTLGPEQLDSLIGLLVAMSAQKNLSADQKSILTDMVVKLLGLNTLSDEQRDLLEGILNAAGETADRTAESIANQISAKISQVKMQGAIEAQLSELQTHTTRLSSIRDWLKSIDATLKAMPKMQSGGVTAADGLVFLHAGERVLSPTETRHYRALVARASEPRATSQEPSAARARPVGGDGAAAGLTGPVVVRPIPLREPETRERPVDRSPAAAALAELGRLDPAAVQALLELVNIARRGEQQAERDRQAQRRRSAAELQQREELLAVARDQRDEAQGLRRDLRKGGSPAGGR